MPGMPWFKYFPKDIAIATDGMSLEDFAIAVKLMGTYTSSGQPIDGEMAASRFGAKGDRVRFVLKALFTEMDDDKWIYEPLREQLEAYQARSAVNKSNAANTRSQSTKASRANCERIATESLADGEQIADASHANGEQITETEERRKNIEEVSARKPCRTRTTRLNYYGLPDELVADWNALRNAKKAPLTQTAVDEFKLEADKAGWTLEQAVRFSLKIGSTGFFASWDSVKNASAQQGVSGVTDEERRERQAWLEYCEPFFVKNMRPPLSREQWREQYLKQQQGMNAEDAFALEGGRA